MPVLQRLLLVLAVGGLLAGCNCAPVIGELPDGGGDASVEPVDSGPPNDAGFDAGVPDGGPDAGALTCSSCHGTAKNPAPPRDTLGRTEQGLPTIGAHQAHLGPSLWHRDGRCDDCHLVPTHPDDPGHLDPSPAEVVWSGVANAGGIASSWDGGTCATYCHGPTLTGGQLTQPDWTRSGSTQAYCGDCHGLPPPAPHPQNVGADCARCHPNAKPGLGFAEPQRHIDGVLDVSVECTTCHGSNGNPAPPVDVAGRTSTSLRTVGAHRSHLGPSTWHLEFKCNDCHLVPTRWDDPGHIDLAPAELTWSAHATAKGANPTFDGVTCSGAYCHGATIAGGSNKTPTWTDLSGAQKACGTCHSLPPTSIPHLPSMTLAQCGTCHPAVINTSVQWVDPSLHINGLVEVTGGACGTCHDLPPATGAHLKHAGLAPATYGGLDTAANLTNPTGYAFGCAHCHPSDSAKHANGGLAEIELYNANAPAGSLKRRSPGATYTPGPTVFTDSKGKQYTEGTCGNVYCHSGPTYATPNAVPVPGVDFAFTGYPIVYPAFTLLTGRAYASPTWGGAALPCTGCHALPLRTLDPAVHAASGQSHSWIDAAGNEVGHAWNHGFTPLSCRTCHNQTVTTANAPTRTAAGVSIYNGVPISGFGFHVNGNPDVAFDQVNPVQYGTSLSLGAATYSQATATCSNVACHLSQSAVKNGTPHRSTTVTAECNACHQY